MDSVRLTDPALRARVEDFLYHEADLLDARRFEEWLALLTDDVEYVMPLRLTRESQAEWEFSPAGRIYADTKETLRIRVERLATEYAWAEQPASRTRRIVANVRVRPSAVPGEIEATCNLLVYRNRGDTTGHELYSAARCDLLRPSDDGWQIARRRIELDQSNVVGHNISIFF